MTITKEAAFEGPYAPNGVTTAFPFNAFQVMEASEIAVILDGLTVSQSSYSVSLNADGTGTVNFFVAPTGTKLFIYSDPDFTQMVKFENQGPYFQKDFNPPLDKAAVRDIALRDQLARAVRFGPGTYADPIINPPANSVLGFDGLGVFGPLDGSAFKGDPGADASAVGLASVISSLTIAAPIDRIVTSGFSQIGLGAASYVRTGTPSSGEQAAGLNRWLFRSNGNTVWWRLDENMPTDFMFGVVGDASLTYAASNTSITGTDDTAALQAAIDYTIYFSTRSKTLLIPHSRLRRITDTIHVGYGTWGADFCQIIGDSSEHRNFGLPFSAGIVCTFNDRPAISVHGMRRSVVRGLSIIGVNAEWLYANFNSIPNIASKSAWRGPQMRSVGTDTSRRPHAGIAVDPYAHAAPVNAYPSVNYPAWLFGTGLRPGGSSAQYGKNYSSQLKFEDIRCWGFEVGCVVHPNSQDNVPSNGDFIRWEDCDFSFNEVGIAITHSDARSVALRGVMGHFCHTFFDSVTYGAGEGNVNAHLSDCSFDNCYQVFNVNLGDSGAANLAPPLVITNGYSEALYSLGVVRANAETNAGSAAVLIEGGQFNFFTGKLAAMFTPKHYLDGKGVVRLFVRGACITGTYGIFPVDCDVIEFEAVFPSVAYSAFIQGEEGGRRGGFTSGGLWSRRADRVNIKPFALFSYASANLSSKGRAVLRSHGFDRTVDGQITATGSGGRGAPIPWFVRSIDYQGHHHPISRAPQFVLNRATYNLSSVSNSGKETTFSFSLDSVPNTNSDPSYHLGVGDIVRDDNDGRLGYVKSVGTLTPGAGQTATLVVSWVTGIYTANGTTWTSDVSLSTNTGTLTFTCGRRVSMGLTKRLLMNAASGSGTFTLVEPGTETLSTNQMGASGIYPVNVNDYLLGGTDATTPDESVFPAYAKITTVTAPGAVPNGEIIVNKNARRTGLFIAPLVIKAG